MPSGMDILAGGAWGYVFVLYLKGGCMFSIKIVM